MWLKNIATVLFVPRSRNFLLHFFGMKPANFDKILQKFCKFFDLFCMNFASLCKCVWKKFCKSLQNFKNFSGNFVTLLSPIFLTVVIFGVRNSYVWDSFVCSRLTSWVLQNSGVDVGPGISLSMAFRRFEYEKINRKSHNFECVSERDWSSVLPPSHLGKNITGIEYASTDFMLCDQTCSSMYVLHHITPQVCKLRCQVNYGQVNYGRLICGQNTNYIW